MMHVAIVMPPATELSPDDALDRWGTVTGAASALLAAGEVVPTVHARHRVDSATVERDGVTYRFHSSDGALARAVRAERPAVVHVHGLGWTRLLLRLHHAGASIVVQHHGEPPFTGRRKWAHRLVRRSISAYLFTGASLGQADPWIAAGVIRVDARCCEVLESASLLPADRPEEAAAVVLQGQPVVLWVGRLIDSKDPLTAIDGFALAAARVAGAHLHLLVTERAMEFTVRARLAELGEVAQRIHLHDAVPYAEMAGWYRAAGLFLSTSRREGSGYSLIEAVTCGCIPVVSAIAPHLAIIGECGTSFPVGDAVAAGAALERMAAGWVPGSVEPTVAERRTLLSWGSVAAQMYAAYCSSTA